MQAKVSLWLIWAGSLLFAAVSAAYVMYQLTVPITPPQRLVFKVEKGQSLRRVLGFLEAHGGLRSAAITARYAQWLGSDHMQAGVYELVGGHDALDVLAMLANGRVLMRSVTLAEGLNRFGVREVLTTEGWMSAKQFDALCDDQNLLRQQAIPGPSCEGYLAPDTYKFPMDVSPRVLFTTLLQAYRANLVMINLQQFGPDKLSEREFVTLASIVEKETSMEKERTHVACVFYNRLHARPRWRLETDPTVIYAARLQDPNFDGNLTRYHLHQMDSPYNTYRIFGLPPGPIANPSRASLWAVAHPIACKDFFFVSTNAGHHVFCPDLACHRRAVELYQVQYFKQKR